MSRQPFLLATALSAAMLLAACKTTPSVVADDQGWDTAARNAWYNGDQGSRLMPLKWFEALEQPMAPGAAPGAVAGHFLDPAYLDAFRILPPASPGALPVGFAIDSRDDSRLNHTSLHWLGKPAAQDKVDWVGLNCAACHTAQMTYGDGPPITVQGGPSLFHFQRFIAAVDTALRQTRDDAGRWDRFAKSVLGANDTAQNRAQLLAALNKLIAWEDAAEQLNQTPGYDYGFGRVDAVGHIYNRTLLFGGAAQPIPNPADAPVSYPHLWNITRETRVQWDGIATNSPFNVGQTPTDYGALGRNVGEVLGVFGEAVIAPRSGSTDFSGFTSSVDVESLNAMETLVGKLRPPAWPNVFPTPGSGLKDEQGKDLDPQTALKDGQALFDAHCASCHTPNKTYETVLTFQELGENQTDEWMACNAWAYKGLSGQFAGIPASYVKGDPLTAAEPGRVLLTTAVKGVLVNRKFDLIKIAAQNLFGVTPLPRVNVPQRQGAPPTRKELQLAYCQANAADPLMAYKARPLEGIWATAPYLHNGSVPTLYALLSPVSERPVTFPVGTRRFDPVNVGYDVKATAEQGNSFTFDTRLDGNSNKGHVYGVDKLSVLQRRELVEYLKVIQEPPR
jgi:mono/diheme cytochrome c family protein